MFATSTTSDHKTAVPSQFPRVTTSWRRYLRFSMRGLILLVLVIGGGLGWLVRSARIQRDAVAAITAADGSVSYSRASWAPMWLVNSLGIDYFDHVVAVVLPATSPRTDALIAHGARLTQLESLNVVEPSMTDAQLARLECLTNLSMLALHGSQITDAGMVHLKGMTRLSVLEVSNTQVSGAGLVHLQGLRSLKTILLANTSVTDRGIANLSGLSLRSLDLSGSKVTDAGLEHLA
jgi:internalin A